MPGWFSPWELLLLILLVLVIFGPKRLPEIGRGLGKGMREFKDSVTGKHEKEAKRAELAAAASEGEAEAADDVRRRDSVSS
jgi:sec-independent protein translocase protein TatA